MTDTDQRNVAAFTLWSLIYQREQPFLPGMRTLIYSFLNHWNLFAWEFDLWWDSETLYIPTISFCFLNCDLTQVMPWFWVSDKICDVNELYITHIQVITFIFKEICGLCMEMYWMNVGQNRRKYVELGWMSWNWFTKHRYYLQLFTVADK